MSHLNLSNISIENTAAVRPVDIDNARIQNQILEDRLEMQNWEGL